MEGKIPKWHTNTYEKLNTKINELETNIYAKIKSLEEIIYKIINVTVNAIEEKIDQILTQERKDLSNTWTNGSTRKIYK